MQPLATVHGWQFIQLENNQKTVEWILRSADPAVLTTYRDGGSGWTALEVLCHLRDFEQVFLERLHITVEQDKGALPFPKPDDLAAAGNYNSQNVEDALAAWKATRASLLAFLRERPDSDWERTAIHPVRGELSLNEQLTLATQHDTIHMEQMSRVLYEKKLA